ncbi:hypothetical protein BFJ63_vAg6352 [Fusarium oxysporum f. sp. narcissi]|uniref:Uncharacterized protein n=3 Tax=Fusarium oxysporum TaxID=5507 RepID=A0A420S5H4_FUSOX|nr:hypothetical protein BFJ65_g12746 [Fusarium oxysporum f. sp. cepae]RKL01996.1 hypothetical protein BFJ71_g4874 [Fusarium oxysporum]RYC90735.1 hypothetical protein BFJ63_vAg6352 [Fusarium oxysporum f. sp. narcissi]RKK35902.1 hypothetical protein BFJ67_g13075 [Fusarium oxysporum f. sp. cepae]RKK54936.1 hypothetical protein BFJ66_g4377 [Fusarium oxysporum f. sp. cepae]
MSPVQQEDKDDKCLETRSTHEEANHGDGTPRCMVKRVPKGE